LCFTHIYYIQVGRFITYPTNGRVPRFTKTEEEDQLHPRVWNYEFIQLPLVIKEKQSRPSVTEAEISGLLSSLKERYAVLAALVAGTGLRIGEALAVREDFDPDRRVLHVRRSVWHRREQMPKTPSAIRLVDIPERLARVLRGYTEGKDGFLFTTRAGRVLDQRNSLKALHGAGNRGGFHAFRRFRFAVLRRGGAPENLIKLWLGHSQNLMDLYAAQLRYDVAYRREWCEKAGLGFELSELGSNWVLQFVRHSLRKPSSIHPQDRTEFLNQN